MPVQQGDPCADRDFGERWSSMTIDRASRLTIARSSGPREETLAETVVTTLQRTACQVGNPYVFDG